MPLPPPSRQLGRTGLRVSALGFGSAVIGDLYSEIAESTAVETVLKAINSGVSLIDTSPLYGHGLSEHRIGCALRHAPHGKPILSTKVGRTTDPFSPINNSMTGYAGGAPHAVNFDYSHDGVLRSLEQSLLRLGRDSVEIVLVHDLEPGAHGERYDSAFAEAMDGAVPALTELRNTGIIRGYGIGVNDADAAERFIRNSDSDVVLLAGRYSLLEQPAHESFLPLAKERDLGVILGGVFNSGILATGPVPDARYNYKVAPEQVIDRVKKIQQVCDHHQVSLRAASLQFVFGHPAVSSVVLGAAHPKEIENQLNDFGETIPSALWSELKEKGLIPSQVPVPREETVAGPD